MAAHRAVPTGSDQRGDPVLDPRSTDGGSEVGLVAQQFAELSRTLGVVEPGMTVAQILGRVMATAQHTVTGADVVSVTLRHGSTRAGDRDRFTTPVETDTLASRLDQAQYDAGEGPCIAATSNPGLGVVYSPDLATDPGWPTYGPVAASLGAHAVLSTGILPGGDPPRFAALNYYSHSPNGLDDTDRDTALILASYAGVAIAHLEALNTAQIRETQLHEALESRDVIGQAKGILMERRGYHADQAFSVLRRASQDLNVKLRDIAHTLVERRTEL